MVQQPRAAEGVTMVLQRLPVSFMCVDSAQRLGLLFLTILAISYIFVVLFSML